MRKLVLGLLLLIPTSLFALTCTVFDVDNITITSNIPCTLDEAKCDYDLEVGTYTIQVPMTHIVDMDLSYKNTVNPIEVPTDFAQ